MVRELKKILFVDDDHDIHTIVKLCLQKIPDLEFRSAYSGEEAIKIGLEFQPDLILLNVVMPKMTGITTFEIIRILPTLSKIPVIFLTAKTHLSELEPYLNQVLGVIAKPFDPHIFAQNIEEIWKKNQN